MPVRSGSSPAGRHYNKIGETVGKELRLPWEAGLQQPKVARGRPRKKAPCFPKNHCLSLLPQSGFQDLVRLVAASWEQSLGDSMAETPSPCSGPAGSQGVTALTIRVFLSCMTNDPRLHQLLPDTQGSVNMCVHTQAGPAAAGPCFHRCLAPQPLLPLSQPHASHPVPPRPGSCWLALCLACRQGPINAFA